jgi:hypothetical protein
MIDYRTVEISVEQFTAIFFIVISISHIVQPRAWAELFVGLAKKGAVGTLIDGFIHLPVGVLIVAFHNIWHGPAILVTIIGWGLLIKGFLRFAFPWLGMRILRRVSVERAWEFVVAGMFGLLLGSLILFFSYRNAT